MRTIKGALVQKGRRSLGAAHPPALEEAVGAHFVQVGFTVEEAQVIAELSVHAICSVLEGSQVYFSHTALQAYRDRRIYALANGTKARERELAEEAGLTPRRVRQIVCALRARKGKV